MSVSPIFQTDNSSLLKVKSDRTWLIYATHVEKCIEPENLKAFRPLPPFILYPFMKLINQRCKYVHLLDWKVGQLLVSPWSIIITHPSYGYRNVRSTLQFRGWTRSLPYCIFDKTFFVVFQVWPNTRRFRKYYPSRKAFESFLDPESSC